MRARVLGVVSCAVLVLCVSTAATAGLSDPAYGGDPVVYDETNGVFFYPDMNNDGLIMKTKAQQADYIAQLNDAEYAGITDWRFATFEECFGLMWSMTEHCDNPPDPSDDPPFRASGFDPDNEPLDFFPAQQTWVDANGVTNAAPCGRPADEVGIKIQVPRGSDDFPEIYPRDFNYLFVDGYEEFPQIPRSFAADDPESDNPTQFLTGLPMDGEYHFWWKQEGHPTQGWQMMFDDDHNWGLDDATTVDAIFGSIYKPEFMGGFLYGPLEYWVASAWIVSNTGPLQVDIKPGSAENSVNNNGHGKIPVAILGGSALYDVYDIDPETIALEGMPVAVKPHGQLHLRYKDVNEDGFDDIFVKIQDVAGAVPEGATVARMTCSLFDGTPFQGGDVINLVPHGPQWEEEIGFFLKPNYPNPFNPKTEIFFTVPVSSQVRLEVFSVSGRKVATLVDGRCEEGDHSVEWDATGFGSGVYFYRITTPEFGETRSMVLLK